MISRFLLFLWLDTLARVTFSGDLELFSQNRARIKERSFFSSRMLSKIVESVHIEGSSR